MAVDGVWLPHGTGQCSCFSAEPVRWLVLHRAPQDRRFQLLLQCLVIPAIVAIAATVTVPSASHSFQSRCGDGCSRTLTMSAAALVAVLQECLRQRSCGGAAEGAPPTSPHRQWAASLVA